MKIIRNNCYRIKGKSRYFKGKYGTFNPTIKIEAEDNIVFGGGWGDQYGNPACLLYAVRSIEDGIPSSGKVYYGKIKGLGELVHEIELIELEEQ